MTFANIQIQPYSKSLSNAWDEFVGKSVNGTFLIKRTYMDYHADRFDDMSFLFYEENKLIAILPACQKDDCLYSHKGLTYGGLIVGLNTSTIKVASCFYALFVYLKELGMTYLFYKPTPYLYHIAPAMHDIYISHICKAHLFSRSISTAILLKSSNSVPSKRANGARKALKNNFRVFESIDSIPEIFNLINFNLMRKYGTSACHTCDEMLYLLENNSPDIKAYALADSTDQVVGGSIMYLTKKVAHLQYMIVNDEARKLRGQDLMIFHLCNEFSQYFQYFDFGTSSEEDGQVLNKQLLSQKEQYNGCPFTYDAYRFNINSSANVLEKILSE